MSILAAAVHIYNAADHLEECLFSLLKIKDLDVIHVLDGAWMGGGTRMHSEDKSEQVFNEIRKQYETEKLKFYYTWRAQGELWLTEGKKRNWLISDFDSWYPGQKIWSLVVDADEEVMITDGTQPDIKLKQYLSTEKCGMLQARDSRDTSNTVPWYDTIRVIPHGFDYHYHTHKAMCIHDVDCNVVMDYEYKVKDDSKVYLLDKIYLVNKGSELTPEKQKAKSEYYAYRKTHEGGRCRFRKL